MAKRRLDKTTAEFILGEEQTLLAKERTMLSFVRTGLGFIGVGLVSAKFFGEPIFQIIGAILILIGFYQISRAYRKMSEYEQRLRRVKRVIKESKIGEIEYGKIKKRDK